ncbi:hypothetical protein D0Y65_003016, partial [Glycine soja]
TLVSPSGLNDKSKDGGILPLNSLFAKKKSVKLVRWPMVAAVGAGLTGSKMTRRVGGVDEFEFKAIGENHNQGVGFDIFHIHVFFLLTKGLAGIQPVDILGISKIKVSGLRNRKYRHTRRCFKEYFSSLTP